MSERLTSRSASLLKNNLPLAKKWAETSMDQTEEVKFYDERWAEHSGEQLSGRRLLRAATILDEIAILNPTEPRILDFGCGNGSLAAILRHVGTVTAIDYSPAAIEAAQQRYAGIKFLSGDALTVPLDENAFDIVVSQEVIEHVYDQAAYLDRARKLLIRGGHLILTTPNAFTFHHSGAYEKSLKAGSLQPREDVISIREIRKMMSKHFEIRRLYTICATGRKGLFKIINSPKLQKWVPFWSKLNPLLKLGLHTVVVAEAK